MAETAWITAEQVAQNLGLHGSDGYQDDDPWVAAVVQAVNEALPRYLRRQILVAERTQVFNARRFQKLLALNAYPVQIGDPTPTFTLLEDLRGVFTAPDRTWASDEFHVDRDAGQVFLRGQFMGGAGSVQVTYTGGMAANADALAADWADVHSGAVLWAAETLRRNQSMTTRAKGARGSRQEFTALGAPPPPAAMLLDPHRAMRFRS